MWTNNRVERSDQTEITFNLSWVFIYPGEQNPEGVARPEELQYLPGGQGSQSDLLDNPIWLLKVPAGHGNATPVWVPVDKHVLNLQMVEG